MTQYFLATLILIFSISFAFAEADKNIKFINSYINSAGEVGFDHGWHAENLPV